MNKIEVQLTDRLLEAVKIMKNKHGYNPQIFLQMLEKDGAVEACRKLINAKAISDGFTKLWEFKQLDLTVEAISLEPQWRSLFSASERETAIKRLRQYGFEAPGQDVPADEEPKDDGRAWSREELKATAIAYVDMLRKEQRGEAYNKAEVNRILREGILKTRTKASVEFRMQNISAVMEGLCLPRINGYLPAKNIGRRVFDEMSGILGELNLIKKEEYEPTDNPEEYDARAKALIEKIGSGIPLGNDSPERIEQKAFAFKRDPLVKAWVLKMAVGRCEKCDLNAPFQKDNGDPFLEVHHLIRLSEGGKDKIENTIALCPNCHRELHHSAKRGDWISKLRQKIPRLKIAEGL